MLIIKDLNLIRTNSFYKAETFKGFVVDALLSTVKGMKEQNYTEFFLNKINLEVKKGERVALLGRNGSGKSTLCKVMASQLFASSGQIDCSFQVSLFSQLENIFFKDLSGKENLKYVLKFIYRDASKAELERLLANAIEFSGLGNSLERQMATYSTGMVSRLSLSLILAKNHDLLILDEIQTHADQEFSKKVKEKLADVINGSNTVIMVSHTLEDVAGICERGVVLDKGSIVFDGNIQKAMGVYSLLNLGDQGGRRE